MKKILIFLVLLFFIISCKSNINRTTWCVVSSDLETISLPGGCDDLSLGSVFSFEQKNIIVKKDTENICAVYKYKKIDKKIYLVKDDFQFYVDIDSVSNSIMVLRIRWLPKSMMINWKPEYDDLKKRGYKISLEKIR